MPATHINQKVWQIVGLNNDDIDALKEKAISSKDSLKCLKLINLPSTIRIVKHCKLALVG